MDLSWYFTKEDGERGSKKPEKREYQSVVVEKFWTANESLSLSDDSLHVLHINNQYNQLQTSKLILKNGYSIFSSD